MFLRAVAKQRRIDGERCGRERGGPEKGCVAALAARLCRPHGVHIPTLPTGSRSSVWLHLEIPWGRVGAHTHAPGRASHRSRARSQSLPLRVRAPSHRAAGAGPALTRVAFPVFSCLLRREGLSEAQDCPGRTWLTCDLGAVDSHPHRRRLHDDSHSHYTTWHAARCTRHKTHDRRSPLR